MKRSLTLFVTFAVLASLTLGSCDPAEQPPTEEKPEAAAPAAAGKPDIRGSVEKAVAFLRGAQREDGSWGGKQSDVGITGLVIEALAGVPDDIRTKNADIIEKGITYILSQRRDDGSIVNEDGMVANYRTSIATRALIAVDPVKYKDTIDAAVKYTKGIQGKDPNDKAKYGSMGYGSDETKGDQINLGEALEMLSKAGLSKDDEAYKLARVFLARTQSSDEEHPDAGVKTANDFGGVYRSDRGAEDASKAGTITLPDGTKVPRSYGSATYSLLKSLLFCGLKKDNVRVKGAYQWIADHYTVKENPEMGAQGLYYYYYTMARTLELWGEPTIKKGSTVHNWAEELAAQIISLQRDDGSWVNAKDRWWEADPTLVTAYTIYSLNSCQRMLK